MIRSLYVAMLMFFSTFAFSQTVVDIIVNSPDHNTLETAVVAAGLVPTLSSSGPFTVFAPTDEAFDALPPEDLNALLQDPTGDLTKILIYHVLDFEAKAASLSDGQEVRTIMGQNITVTINTDGVFINDAKVSVTDIEATNGVVHVLDAVILPPASTVVDVIVDSPVHNTLETAVIQAGLAGTLSGDGPFTVFAPTDAAFDLLPMGQLNELLQDPAGDLAKILMYHVLGAEVLSSDLSHQQSVRTLLGQNFMVTINSDGVFINDAKVSVTDIQTFNGVVHVLDAVITPPSATVAEIVLASPNHNTLETAVVQAGLAGTLSGDGPFTVFAPTDEAFDLLPMGELDQLLQDPTGDLAKVLMHHVVEGEILSSSLSNGQMATTLLGQGIMVNINSDGVFINDAKVSVTDIQTFNGVVHVLDAVLAPAPTVVDVIVNSPNHTILETAVTQAGLAGALSGDGPFTVFAPTDAAFGLLPAGELNTLLQDPTGNLAKILTYHVLEGEVLSSTLTDGQTATTLLGQGITVTINSDGVFINNAKVSVTDIRTFNGVVHVLDAVILPTASNVVDVIVNSPNHNTLETAVTQAGLVNALTGDGPFTVFAPTDAAFDLLPAGELDALLADPTGDLAKILLNHVIEGEVLSSTLTNGQTATTLLGQGITVTINADGVFINDAKVSVTDIRTFNGVVHVLDAVILPTATTVVDVIVNSPNHNTLETAVTQAQLVDALSGDGPFTVFAPTDAAFDLLPMGELTTLLQDPTGDLARILLYHVLEGEVLSSTLMDGQVARTLLGQNVEVTINADGVFISGAKVSVTDIRTLNGVVHVLDAVMLPPAATVVDVIVDSPNHNTLETAVTQAQLAGALSGDGPFTVFAPTDAAFDLLPAGELDALLADPTGDLAKVLRYHVLEGEVLSNTLTDGQVATTLANQDINVTINADGVFIEGVKVSVTDIRTFNGVVHVLDGVLLPILTSVKDLNKAKLSVSPNPTTDFVNIEVPAEMANERVTAQWIDVNGKVVRTWTVGDRNTTSDVRDFAEGTYFLVLQTNTTYAINTVIVNK